MSRENSQRFQNHLTELEGYFRELDDNDPDDPTLDLNNLDVVVHHQQDTTPNENTSKQAASREASLDELKFLYLEIKKGSSYANKLANIMLEGVQKTLGIDTYMLFTKKNLPPNWLPIVRMNSKNTPYIEFLVKSDEADQDPESQFSDFTMEHVMYSNYIVTQLCSESSTLNSTSRSKTPNPKSSSLPQITSSACKRPIHSTPIKNAPRRHSMPKRKVSQIPLQPQQQQQQPQPQTNITATKPADPTDDRPPQQPPHKQPKQKQDQQQQLVEAKSREMSLNDSIRIQPTRACRINSSRNTSLVIR